MAKVVIPYTPRPLQRQFHEQRTRFCVLLCHRRFGKTVAAINDLVRQALRSGKADWRAAYAAPFYSQAKSVAWDYLKFYAGPVPGVRFNESELRCDFPNGARIRLFGTDNANALRGMYLDDLVLDEPADMVRSVWTQVLRPMLADRQGRALFCGTPHGTENLLYDVWQQAGEDNTGLWSRFRFPARSGSGIHRRSQGPCAPFGAGAQELFQFRRTASAHRAHRRRCAGFCPCLPEYLRPQSRHGLCAGCPEPLFRPPAPALAAGGLQHLHGFFAVPHAGGGAAARGILHYTDTKPWVDTRFPSPWVFARYHAEALARMGE